MSMKALRSILVTGTIALMTGCGFFPAITSPGTTPATSADYVYVVNQTTDTLSGFVVGASTLTSIGSITLPAGLTPASVAVSRANSYVYVGGYGAISCYSVGSGGVLTAVNGGGATAIANFVSLDTSPDGQWLLGLDSVSLGIYVYKINTSTGALTQNSTAIYGVPGAGTVVPRSIRISPNSAFVAIALGSGGDVVFPFATSSGALGVGNNLAIGAAYSDNGLTFDATSGYLLIARGVTGTGSASGIATYSVSNTGGLTPVQTLVASGNGPFSLLQDSTGTYVYAANRGDGTISGYTLAGGNLTALASSPFASGLQVTALARDNSGKYIIAAASGGASDVTLYGVDAVIAGKLDAVAVSSSGTDPAGSVALAATH